MTPRVSVIIPTYRRPDKVLEAVRSVLSQTYTDFDVWIVDDGSNDHTAGAVRPLLSERVHLLQQANGGLSSARNAGIRASSGDYIALLDDDDVCYPERLRTQAEFLDAHSEVGLHFTDVLKVDKAGNRWRFTPTVPRFSEMVRRDCRDGSCAISAREMLQSLLVEKPLKPSAVMMRRRCFQEVGCFDERLGPGEMLDLLLRLARAGTGFGYTDSALVEYRIWGGNIGAGSRCKAPRLAIQILDENRRLSRLSAAEALLAEQGIAYQYYTLGQILEQDGQAASACLAFARAFRRDRAPRYLAHSFACWLPGSLVDAANRLRGHGR